MGESYAIIGIILANLAISYQGFNDYSFKEKFLFHVGAILEGKQWIRLISSGFLHADWTHFAFNMITFYSFGGLIESVFGLSGFFIIYFGSLIGGNALSLFVHKNHYDYRALGASGAVSGIVFASILVDPTMKLYLFFVPIGIPAWLFGIAYILYSIYGMRAQNDNIGHEAHMGGAIVGLLLGIALIPQLFTNSPLLVVALLIPSLLFLLILVRNPAFLITGKIDWHKIFNKKY
jgi:membrane associated rhomboid family serine protease